MTPKSKVKKDSTLLEDPPGDSPPPPPGEPKTPSEPPGTPKASQQFPNAADSLLEDLKDFNVKSPGPVARYMAQGDIEDPEWLDQALSDMNVDVSIKRPFLKYWLNKRGKSMPKDLQRRLNTASRKIDAADEDSVGSSENKFSVDPATAIIRVALSTDKVALNWAEAEKLAGRVKQQLTEQGKEPGTKYVYDSATDQIRMAMADERGGSLEEARSLKAETKKDRKEPEESPFTQNEDGKWIIRPGARATGIDFLALKSLNDAQDRGQPMDPIDALEKAMNDSLRIQALLGGRGNEGGSLTEKIKELQALDEIRGVNKGDTGVSEEVRLLRQELAEEKEKRHQAELDAQKQQIQDLTGKLEEIGKQIANLGTPRNGKTEMDIVDKVASEGIALVKNELAGLRGDLRAFAMSNRLPVPKSPEQREQRHTEISQNLTSDRKVEQLGKGLFTINN